MLVAMKCQGCGFEWGAPQAELTCARCDSDAKIVGKRDLLHTLIIYPDGSHVLREDIKALDLKSLQTYVGGYIELVRCLDGQDMFVNEEGLLLGLLPNEEASRLTELYIVGPAVICLDYEAP